MSVVNIGLMNVQELLDRAEACRDRYWAIDKETRIALGLRPHVGQGGYSTVHTLDAAEAALHQGLRGSFPILTERLVSTTAYPGLTINAASLRELVLQVEPLIHKVEDRLDKTGT